MESVAEYLPNAVAAPLVAFLPQCIQPQPSAKVREVTHMLKAIRPGEQDAAQEKADTVISELRRQRMTRAAELVAESIGETRTYYPSRTATGSSRTNNPSRGS